MHLTIVIPLYLSDPLHLEFTQKTVDSIKTKHDYQVLLIVNHCTPQLKPSLEKLVSDHWSLVTNPKGNILSAAWNLGIKQAFGQIDTRNQKPETRNNQKKLVTGHWSLVSDYCLILNNDLLLHEKAIDNLVAFAKKHPEFLLWSMTEWPDLRTIKSATWDGSFSDHPHFSAFMVSPQTITEVGYFDENLKPAYFEDNDYHIRILLEDKKATATTTAKFYHFGSRTVRVDDTLKPMVKEGYQRNRAYMKKKWGADIHGQSFDPPEKILDFIKPLKKVKLT